MRIAIQGPQAGLHRREDGKQLLELEISGTQAHLPLQRGSRAIETNLRVERAAGHAEAQRFQTQHAVIEHHMSIQIADRQLLTVHDAFASETHIGVHRTPTVGAELRDRQNLVRWLRIAFTTLPFVSAGVGADQGRQITEQQLVGSQPPGQFRPWLARDEGQIAMNVAVADTPIETEIAKGRPVSITQVSLQTTVRAVGRRIRQGDAGQRIEVAQTCPGQLQAQIQRAQILRIGQAASDTNTGGADTHIRLQREGL